MAKSPSLTLPCKPCGYVNEPERVYCHNCGAKLDRSILPKESEVRRETPDKAQRRIKKMTNPGDNPVRREGTAFLKTIGFSILAAGLVLMLRAPADAPPEKNELGNRIIASELMDLANSPQPRAIAFTESELNLALKQMAKAGPGSIAKFDRAYVNLTPGKVRLGMQQSIWGFPLHSGMGFAPEFNKEGKFDPKLTSGNIGRLQVHPALMQYVSYAFPPFRKLATSMKREREYLEMLRDIRIDQGRIILISRGATPAPAAAAAPALAPTPSLAPPR